ncbi:MAG: cation:proton antiporter [Arenicella sp.]|jgi:Kef-type K+ transport system membrane component KefB|nr:cation:proton antiporter [Arenicella sp.]HAU69067.1 cation:proton antiporter [Gammaproteobacteria bacterium]
MHDIEILAIIWISVFAASVMATKTRLTPVLWYLFFGALLTNIGLLPTELPIFIVDLAELGIIIIMFSLGFEEETHIFLKGIKRSWGIAFFGALAPFLIAYTLAYSFWADPKIALMCGLAMMATAVSLTMVSLKTEGLSRSPAATGIMTSAVLDDIASLALVAALVPIATGDATLSAVGLLTIVAKTIAFFVVVTLLGALVFPTSTGWAKNIPFIGNFSLQRLLIMGKSENVVLMMLLIAVLVGLLAHYFGFHPAVGAYMAGLIISQEYFDHAPDNLDESERGIFEQTRMIVDSAAYSWLGPVFFVALGSKLVFDSELFISVLPQSLMLFAGIFVGQILSASLAARFTGGFEWPESWMIGFGMLGRAELAFVVMEIAYVQNQVLTTESFYTLMIACFLLNISVPLTIRWWKTKFGKPINNGDSKSSEILKDEH